MVVTSNTNSLTENFLKYYDGLLRLMAHRLRSTEDAADIVQETYIRLTAVPESWANVQNARAYIFRVAQNLAVDYQRRERRQKTLAITEEHYHSLPDQAPQPDRGAISKEQLKLLNASLQNLPNKARLALLMSRVEGLSHAQVAAQLQVSESMVAKYIAQALRHCRQSLDGQK